MGRGEVAPFQQGGACAQQQHYSPLALVLPGQSPLPVAALRLCARPSNPPPSGLPAAAATRPCARPSNSPPPTGFDGGGGARAIPLLKQPPHPLPRRAGGGSIGEEGGASFLYGWQPPLGSAIAAAAQLG